ncbi:HNH endonuclease [Rhodovarius crocodyli]|uniref:HNH endonuclease n=1 Tax=Rhodovarius crocodyli TaxID=1979269 RepID=A0A437MF69_9PROT|nr:HNH endonuclease [Rhodovarius crocodyli]RVT96311.1 HNH endonuclease [Rhodovarius crocodyli]
MSLSQPDSATLARLDPEVRKALEIDFAWRQHREETGTKLYGRTGRALFDRICGEQNWRCCHCGFRTNLDVPGRQPTREHIIPRSLGGPNTYDNLALACARCNGERGSNMDWQKQ